MKTDSVPDREKQAAAKRGITRDHTDDRADQKPSRVVFGEGE